MSSPSDADRLSGIVIDSLDEGASGDTLARRAYRSRTQFFRVFRAVIDETPAAMRPAAAARARGLAAEPDPHGSHGDRL